MAIDIVSSAPLSVALVVGHSTTGVPSGLYHGMQPTPDSYYLERSKLLMDEHTVLLDWAHADLAPLTCHKACLCLLDAIPIHQAAVQYMSPA